MKRINLLLCLSLITSGLTAMDNAAVREAQGIIRDFNAANEQQRAEDMAFFLAWLSGNISEARSHEEARRIFNQRLQQQREEYGLAREARFEQARLQEEAAQRTRQDYERLYYERQQRAQENINRQQGENTAPHLQTNFINHRPTFFISTLLFLLLGTGIGTGIYNWFQNANADQSN